jgi:16S rRNA (cytidine1402-2'-O)-methyltransferase
MLNFISTPIGNLNDISLRAIDVIRSSDYLYAEDTRNVKKILNFIDIQKKCKSFHEHNEDSIANEIIRHIKNKKIVSVVSDAGTPAISDPGYKLIRMCVDQNIKYTLIPGPSSIISALIMSGLPTDRFSFYGFMPRKSNDQEKFIQNLNNENKTSIFFESSKRTEKTLKNLSKFLDSNRKISICKEMTKLHENIVRGNISNILSVINQQKILIKGEVVIVLEGPKKEKLDLKIDSKIKKEFLSKLSAADAAKLISIISGQSKRVVYKKLIEK